MMARWWIAGLMMLAFATSANAQHSHGAQEERPAVAAEASSNIAENPTSGSSLFSSPVLPRDHAADAYFDPKAMAAAREALKHEAGGMSVSMLMIDRLEWRPAKGRDGYAWDVEGWAGGDLDRIAIKSKGEGDIPGSLEKAEVQLGWSHGLDPWFNLRLGVRQDVEPRPRRTHAVAAIEGLAPYWFEVEGELFLSQKGEVTARAEASYDQRITQSLILQPAAELTLSAKDMPDLREGAGLTSVEMGLRLRYEIVREFAPYLGVHWERKFGQTADYARADGHRAGTLRLVTGVRLWF